MKFNVLVTLFSIFTLFEVFTAYYDRCSEYKRCASGPGCFSCQFESGGNSNFSHLCCTDLEFDPDCTLIDLPKTEFSSNACPSVCKTLKITESQTISIIEQEQGFTCAWVIDTDHFLTESVDVEVSVSNYVPISSKLGLFEKEGNRLENTKLERLIPNKRYQLETREERTGLSYQVKEETLVTLIMQDEISTDSEIRISFVFNPRDEEVRKSRWEDGFLILYAIGFLIFYVTLICLYYFIKGQVFGRSQGDLVKNSAKHTMMAPIRRKNSKISEGKTFARTFSRRLIYESDDDV